MNELVRTAVPRPALSDMRSGSAGAHFEFPHFSLKTARFCPPTPRPFPALAKRRHQHSHKKETCQISPKQTTTTTTTATTTTTTTTTTTKRNNKRLKITGFRLF